MHACPWYLYTYSLLCLALGCSQAEITLAGSLVKLQLEALTQENYSYGCCRYKQYASRVCAPKQDVPLFGNV